MSSESEYLLSTSWNSDIWTSSYEIDIGHMFKKRIFWKFLCIISFDVLFAQCEVPGDLVRLLGAWQLHLVQ